MATNGGGKIIRDGLVFGMDNGYGVANNSTATRFYRGEPTTNLWVQSRYTGYNSNTTQTRDTNDIPPLNPDFEVAKIQSLTLGAYGQSILWTTPIPSPVVGDQYTHTAYIYMTEGTYCRVGQHWNPWDYGVNTPLQKNVWTRVSHTISLTDASRTSIANQYSTDGTIYVTMPQYEKGSHSTPFVYGTSRSSTQSLIDLTKSTDIDVSNVSFDSTGQPIYDGTDDSITIADPNVSSGVGFSIEMVLKPFNASSSPMIITPNSGGIDHFVRFNNNGRLYMRMVVAADSSVQDFSTNTSLSSTEYNHVVFTFKQSEGGKAYYGGNLENSALSNFTALDWSSIWKIGQRGNNTYFYQGELPILKVYKEVLTVDEITQNYNVYKNRFNL